MNAGSIDSSRMTEFGRMDAKFLLLAESHRPLYEELMATLSREEICELAKSLPFDPDAAEAVYRAMRNNKGPVFFFAWVEQVKTLKSLLPSKHRDVAVYCCAAAQMAASKILEEVLELSRQKEKKLQGLKDLLTFVKEKQCHLLSEVMKKGSKDSLKEVTSDKE